MTFQLLKCPVIDGYCSLHKVDGGCAYPGGKCKEVIAECAGCRFIVNNHCKIYPNLAAKWQTRRGCPRMYRMSNWEKTRYGKNKEKKDRKDEALQGKDQSQKAQKTEQKNQKTAPTKNVGRIRRFLKKLLNFY